jgi:hypothetical protein
VLNTLPQLIAAMAAETPVQLRARLHDLVPDESRRNPLVDTSAAQAHDDDISSAVAV